MQDQRLELMVLAKPGETCRLKGTGSGLGVQESASPVFGPVKNRTDTFLGPHPVRRELTGTRCKH
jgi:hypothetical protein